MSNLGLGVMIDYLAGQPNKKASDLWIGKKIKSATMNSNSLKIEFKGAPPMRLIDDGQSCCEHRYMTCDDDLSILEGAEFLGITEKEHKSTDGEYGDSHEIVFVDFVTSKGTVTVCTHNKHNGYYGGFSLKLVTS